MLLIKIELPKHIELALKENAFQNTMDSLFDYELKSLILRYSKYLGNANIKIDKALIENVNNSS